MQCSKAGVLLDKFVRKAKLELCFGLLQFSGGSTVVRYWLVVVWQVAEERLKFKPTFVEKGRRGTRPLEGVEHGSRKGFFIHQNGLAMVAAELVSDYNPVVAQLIVQLQGHRQPRSHRW